NALNKPSEIGVDRAVTGIPTAEVTARSDRSIAWRPASVTNQSWSLYEISMPCSGRIAPTDASSASGVASTEVCTDGATLSGLITVSHSAHCDSGDEETGVAYGAPGIPSGWPLGIRSSSSDLTATGLLLLPRINRAEVRL